MNVSKAEGWPVTEGDLKAINALARKGLKADEVYTFAVRLCDNQVDREGERFPLATLKELAPLCVGKSGIFDHQWSAKGQTARIYRAEVVRQGGEGEGDCYLKGYAYMLRTPANAGLIAEIEGGIKKEVSVGCAVTRSVCSVCGGDMSQCPHEKGKVYDGKPCWAELVGATDLYEWSFVAVPAQKGAGVMKGLGADKTLEKQAALGRRYLDGLRGETARLLGLCSPNLAGELAGALARGLEEGELLAVQQVCKGQLDCVLGRGPQLSYLGETVPAEADGAFLI